MIVLFTVLRLLAILIVSHDMSGLLKTWHIMLVYRREFFSFSII